MMKKIILVFILVFNYSVGQNNYANGKITYTVKVGFDDWFSSVPKDMQDVFISETESKTYELKFSGNFSEFKLINDLKNNDDSYYFRDTNENFALRYQNDSDFGKIIISHKRDHQWELLNETKVILDFVCYKALTTYEEVIKGEIRKHQLIAWYCPEIPISSGPFGYSLPGLILEFQDRNVVYGASKIEFSKTDITIHKPSKGKQISEVEYKKMIESLFDY